MAMSGVRRTSLARVGVGGAVAGVLPLVAGWSGVAGEVHVYAALALPVAGVALVGLRGGGRSWTLAPALLVAALGVASVAAPAGALTGLAILLLGGGLAVAVARSPAAALASQALAGGVLALTVAGVFAHGLAPLTVALLLVPAAGLVAARRDAGLGRLWRLDSAAGRLARWASAAALGLPLVVGFSAIASTVYAALLVALALVGAVHAERERAATASDGDCRRIQDATDDALWVHRERRVLSANAAAARALGYTASDELTGQGLFEHVHPDDRGGLSEAIDGRGGTSVARFRRRGGDDVMLELVARPIAWQGEAAVLVRGRDVTTRQRADDELRRSGALLRAILDSTSYMVVSTTADGVVQEVNRAAELALGWSRDELVGRATPALFHDPAELAALPPGGGAGVVDERECNYVRKDGSRFPVLLSRTTLVDAAGRVTGSVGIASDITEAKRAHRELVEAKEAAESAMRSRSEFLARMSHEIRTPLNGVIGMTDLTLATELDRLQRDYLDTARASAEHLLALISDILDFSRIDAGKLRIESTSFVLADTLGGVLPGLAARAYQKGLELILDIAPEVPTRVIGDPHRLAQIVVNLVGNAIKFTDSGEVVVSAGVAARVGDRLTLDMRVRDTGIGIESDKLEVIFDAFQQADVSMARRYGGTGLGLSISRDLAIMMGGEMRVSSVAGLGSEFAFTIVVGHDATAVPAGRNGQLAALAGTRVMVIEDNTTLRELLSRILSSWGLAVTALLPAEAKRLTTLEPHRLLIIDADDFATDVASDILTVVRRLRGDDAHAPPVVIMSAGSRGATRGERSWIAGHLPKPITTTSLKETVEAVLSGARRRSVAMSTSLGLRPVTPRRVLIADDNAVNRKVARGILERAGHEVVAVEHGRAALEALGRERFDVLLVDVEMPVLDGLETTRAIRAAETGRRSQRLPIVAVTAQAMSGDKARCLAAGADAYVTKPFQPNELLALIAELVPAPTAVAVRRESVNVAPVGPAIWNRAELLDRVSGDRALLLELVELFLEHGPRLRAQLASEATIGDVAAMMRTAHQVKGTLATLAAHPASITARELEDALRSGDTCDLVERVRALSEALLRVEEAVATERMR